MKRTTDLWNTRRETQIQTKLINHLERMDNTRLPKHALNYKPRGRSDRGCPRRRWQRVDAEQVKRPNPWMNMMKMIHSFFVD